MHRYREFIVSHACLAYPCNDKAEGKSGVRVELYFPEARSVWPAEIAQQTMRHTKNISGKTAL